MSTNTKTKKVVKKVTKKAAVKKNNTVTMTAAQANTLVNALAKAGKSYKFLNNKVAALNA